MQKEHDYLMKVPNNDAGWQLIKTMRANAKQCGSSYKLVLRGSKPVTPWGWRTSIPLSEAREIRIYIRRKDNECLFPASMYYDKCREGYEKDKAIKDLACQIYHATIS
jgi:hypothetical protein